ncbi:acetolactate synthase AlsS [Candidatus Nanopelagicales bacterium]|nr:acetolactate synthase AlsS [Candidatus Nanopelagicales bacterium]
MLSNLRARLYEPRHGVRNGNTSEGSPVIGIGGAVPRADRLKQAHQSLETEDLFRPVTKFSVEIEDPDAIAEVTANAFRAAESGRPGAAFISFPYDVSHGPADDCVLTPVTPAELGAGDADALGQAAEVLKSAKAPVALLGMMASRPGTAESIRAFLKQTGIPAVSTFQGGGVVSKDMTGQFGGRVGLFGNQPGDRLLAQADTVITFGYDPIEYDESLWNAGNDRPVIHVDCVPSDIDRNYRPAVEIVANIGAAANALSALLAEHAVPPNQLVADVRAELDGIKNRGVSEDPFPVHPLRLIEEMRKIMTPGTTVALDMGSFHIWNARYLHAFRPNQIMVTNGQQTLGVAMPWTIAVTLARPDDTVISVSGDGGFHFSSQELETAVRLGCNFTHIVWRDGHYNMFQFQEQLKYGRDSGVSFGPIDNVAFAKAHGATGLAVENTQGIAATLAKAINTPGPTIVEIPVDYSHHQELAQQLLADQIV